MITPRVELRTAWGGSRTAGNQQVLYHDDREPANARARRTHDAPAIRQGRGAAPCEAARAEGPRHRRRRALPPAVAPRRSHALYPAARDPAGRGRDLRGRRDRHQPGAARAPAPAARHPAARRKRLRRGQRMIVHGRGARYKDKITLQVQEWETVDAADDEPIHAGALVPVYPSTEGLPQ